jgi:hypothetical protein
MMTPNHTTEVPLSSSSSRARLPSPALLVLIVLSCTDYNPAPMKNTAPTVLFLSPSDGASYQERQVVAFTAQVDDRQDDPELLDLTWSSDLDLVISEGDHPDANGIATLATANLSPGTHTLTLTAWDGEGLEGSDWIRVRIIEVPDAPSLEILHPAVSETGIETVLFTFEALVSDSETAASDLVVLFESDLDGIFCEPEPDAEGRALCEESLSAGRHELVFSVQDEEGHISSATRRFTVHEASTYDWDGDGWSQDEGDCDDEDPDVYPYAAEDCDGVDQDCDGTVDEGTSCYDDDGDCACEVGPCAGSASGGCGGLLGGDCNDAIATVHPSAIEVCDGVDQDCDALIDEGTSCYDDDGDGFSEIAGDCDDASTVVYPGAPELLDGRDNDCDGILDEGTAAFDDDGDCACESAPCAGTIRSDCGELLGGDCDDANATIPGPYELCDGVDNDCDGVVDEDDAFDAPTWYADLDGDSYGDPSSARRACLAPTGYLRDASDCDDRSAAVSPAGVETCNDMDDDCDGAVDEGVLLTWYRDADADGYGDARTWSLACALPAGHVSNSLDCDDGDPLRRPGALEACNGLDDDCDGDIDEGATALWYRDADSDGYGNASVTIDACSPTDGYVGNPLDCDDTRAAVNPGAVEICNGLDDDCDASVDEAGAVGEIRWYYDGDSDGYGDPTTAVDACSAPARHVANGADCDDARASSNPIATEYCNGYDDDCDGVVDEGSAADASTWYLDADGDGYGIPGSTTRACSLPAGYSAVATDCDDGRAADHPGATETCDGRDNDCDGLVDEGVTTVYYQDADGDGYGNLGVTVSACSAPSGYTLNATDCDDTNASVSPVAPEICNGVDDDCDASVDEGLLSTFYRDADGDGYGNASESTTGCTAPTGYVANAEDCNDSDATRNPTTPWYRDADGDGYGNPSMSLTQCLQPTGYVLNSSDCNDSSDAAYPGRTEECDGFDNDCDGSVDEAGAVGCTTYYYDYDSDAYGRSSPSRCTCEPSGRYTATVGTDCYDANALAYPGATPYYAVERGDDSFDYNCDGTETQRYTANWTCTLYVPYVYCTSTDGWSTSSDPACGATGWWNTGCTPLGTSCTYESRSSRTQTCR